MKRNSYDLVFRGDRDPFFDDWFDLDFPFARGNKREIMKTDIKELDNAYVLEVDLPGFDKKDVNLNLENGYLTISAKREHHYESDKKDNYIRRERSFGQFSRSFYVGDVKEEDIEAHLDNGILEIKLPKENKEKKGTKRIEIK